MAGPTFAALFLAHVIADYVAQTRWMVENKRQPAVIGVHILIVFLAMTVVFLQVNPWFLALAVLHLLIDLVKTYGSRGGLAAYCADQALHIASIGLIAWWAPWLWESSALCDIPWVLQAYLILAALIFATRGGQFAVATLCRNDPARVRPGLVIGWIERSALCLVVAVGLPLLIPLIIAAKGVHIAVTQGRHDPMLRRLRWQGAGLSLLWGLASAAILWVGLVHMGLNALP